MIPIGPAPVMRTSSPSTGKVSAVCTALPNGSKIGRHVEVDAGQVTPHVHGRQGDVLGESAREIDPDTLGPGTLHAPAGNAVAAAPADQMTFAAHEVAYLEVVDVRAELDDLADELMADDERDGDVSPAPTRPTNRCAGRCRKCRSAAL